jgi:hypothetical protein
MESTNLVDLIGESETLREVFDKLKGLQMLTARKIGGYLYKPILARKEFALLEEIGKNKPGQQYINPYGTTIGYYVYNSPEKD